MPTAPPIAYAPPPQPVYQQPPQAPPPPQQQMQYAYPPPQRGLPAWLVTAGVFLGLLAAGYAFYTLVLNKRGASSAAAATQTEEKAATKTGRGRDLSKHLEVAGIRIHEENHKPAIRLMLVNHSGAELTQLTGTITLMTDPQNEVATIPFNLASLGAYEAKDISAPLKTKLRAYELPDWQFIKAQVKLNPSSANE